MKKQIIPGFIGAVVVVFLSYGGWQLGRWLNYSLSYEGMVIETVCLMVQPEYLKQPSDCQK